MVCRGWEARALLNAFLPLNAQMPFGIIADAARRLREKGLLLDLNKDTAAFAADSYRDDLSR